MARVLSATRAPSTTTKIFIFLLKVFSAKIIVIKAGTDKSFKKVFSFITARV